MGSQLCWRKPFNTIIEDQFKTMFETSFIVFTNGRQFCSSHAPCLHITLYLYHKVFMCVDIEKFLFYFLFAVSLVFFALFYFVLRIEFLVDEGHHKSQNRCIDVLVVINGTGARVFIRYAKWFMLFFLVCFMR